MSDERLMQIGEVADRVGLSLRTVRYYEEVELVAPVARSQGGFRLYDSDAVDRLLVIKQMKPLDFSLDEMREILDMRARLSLPGVPRAVVDAIRDRLLMYAAVAEQRCNRLRDQLDAAEAFSATLRREVRRTATVVPGVSELE